MSIKWNKYTWYSKLGALILFILVIPVISFYIGMQYQSTVDTIGVPKLSIGHHVQMRIYRK